jgi:hypothetical protein
MSDARPSTFVTVLAWIALIFSGMAAATGLLQSAMVAFLMPAAPMSASESAGVPPFIVFVFDHVLGFVVVLTAVWAATFVFALGLLRRREWGRQGFVAILIFWCITTLIIAVVQQTMMSDMFGGELAADAPAEAASIILVMRIAAALFGLVFAAAFGWLAWRLRSSSIRAEFS